MFLKKLNFQIYISVTLKMYMYMYVTQKFCHSIGRDQNLLHLFKVAIHYGDISFVSKVFFEFRG